jgi:hypothetical protein
MRDLDKGVVGGAVIIGHAGDLAFDAMAQCVESGPLFAFFCWPCGHKGVAAVGFELVVGHHLPRGLLPILTYHGQQGMARAAGWEQVLGSRLGVAGIGDVGVGELFSRAVNSAIRP